MYNMSIEWVIFVLKTSTIISRASLNSLLLKLLFLEMLVGESSSFSTVVNSARYPSVKNSAND